MSEKSVFEEVGSLATKAAGAVMTAGAAGGVIAGAGSALGSGTLLSTGATLATGAAGTSSWIGTTAMTTTMIKTGFVVGATTVKLAATAIPPVAIGLGAFYLGKIIWDWLDD